MSRTRTRVAEKTIFTVTAMGGRNEETSGAWMRDRVWGWYSTWEAAHAAVIANMGDMNEAGYYDIILIEEVSEGIIAMGRNTWWYKYNEEKDIYESMEDPEWADGIVNWSMG